MAPVRVRSKLVEDAQLVKKKKEEHHLDRTPFQLMYLLAMGGGYRCVDESGKNRTNATNLRLHQRKHERTPWIHETKRTNGRGNGEGETSKHKRMKRTR